MMNTHRRRVEFASACFSLVMGRKFKRPSRSFQATRVSAFCHGVNRVACRLLDQSSSVACYRTSNMLPRIGFGLSLAVSLVTCAHAQITSTHVEIVTGGGADTGYPNSQTFLGIQQANGDRNDPNTRGAVSVSDEEMVSYDNTQMANDGLMQGTHAQSHAYAQAFATWGAVEVLFSGLVGATNDVAHPNLTYGGSAGVESAIDKAEFLDKTLISVPGRPDGATIVVHSHLNLRGSFQNAFNGDTSNFSGNVQLFMSITGHGGLIGGNGGNGGLPPAPYDGLYFGKYVENSNGVDNMDLEPPSSIPITLFLENNAFDTLGFTLNITGQASVSSSMHSGTIPGSISDAFVADFGHTLTWGGIDSVTDATTGEALDGWTFTSESGVDYSKPISVPEPATLKLFACGLAIIASQRRRGWRSVGADHHSV
jgi:hypothetical protein